MKLIKNYFLNRKFKKINNKLSVALLKKNLKREGLKNEIYDYLTKTYDLERNKYSEFFKIKLPTREVAYTLVIYKYGDRLKELNMSFNKKMQVR